MAVIRKINEDDILKVSKLVAAFRVELQNLKEIVKDPDSAAGKEELEDYMDRNFPVFVAEGDNKEILGYLVCRVDDGVLWAESLYVTPEYRREGIASLLYNEAEKLAEELGNDTVYNWVHPNNDRMINFLRKNGYDVLNLIEVRRPRKDEKLNQKIKVDKYEFNY